MDYLIILLLWVRTEHLTSCCLLGLPDNHCLFIKVDRYRSRGPGLDSRTYQIFLERVPLSLVRTIEEVLE
jgi:hypothetical protein